MTKWSFCLWRRGAEHAFPQPAQGVLEPGIGHPVELRFEKGSVGDSAAGRAVLHLVLVDARRSRPLWAIEVVSEPATSFSPALAASVAEHLADLIAAP